MSHDFIQNKILNALASTISDHSPQQRVRPYLKLFLARKGEVNSLISTALVALNPMEWVFTPIDNDLSPSAAIALRHFAALSFFGLSSIPNQLTGVSVQLSAAVQACSEALSCERQSEHAALQKASVAMKQLADALSALPTCKQQVMDSMRR